MPVPFRSTRENYWKKFAEVGCKLFVASEQRHKVAVVVKINILITLNLLHRDAINVNVFCLVNNYVKWLFGHAECDIVGGLFV